MKFKIPSNTSPNSARLVKIAYQNSIYVGIAEITIRACAIPYFMHDHPF